MKTQYHSLTKLEKKTYIREGYAPFSVPML